MNRLEHIKRVKQIQGKKWNELAKGLAVSGNALRIAFTRKRVSEVYLNHIESKLGIPINKKYKDAYIISKKAEDIDIQKEILVELKTIRRLLEAKTT